MTDRTNNFLPIGYVENSVHESMDAHWGEVESVIALSPRLAQGLKGLEQYSHVVVVYWMDRSSFDPERDLTRRPRGRADMPEVGIFAQRAKHRPNPIGITAVRLLGVEGNHVRVRGLDALDRTPVLDLKPYVPAFDHVDDATVPDWTRTLMEGYF